MPRSSQSAVATRLGRIKDVAHDLALELGRTQFAPTSVPIQLATFIEAEAEAAIGLLKKSQRPPPAR